MKYIAFLVFTTLGTMAFAIDPAKDVEQPCRREDQGPHLQKELNLTEKQKEKVKLLHEKYAPLVESKKKAMKALNEELVTQLQGPEKGSAAKALLTEKFKKYQAARNELYLTRFEMALETRELLSDEQIKKYKAYYHFKGQKDDIKEKMDLQK